MDSWFVESEIFMHPFNCLIAGPTQSGKTSFIDQIIKNRQILIHPSPDRIIYCYSKWQEKYVEMKTTDFTIEFHKGIYNLDEINPNINNLIIFDDLAKECENNPAILDLFVAGSHHQNISTFFICPNLFSDGKYFRTMSLNSHYLVLLKNPRDKTQISVLARQIYPNKSKFMIEAFQDAVENKIFGYLLLDFKQTTLEKNRVQTGIIPGEQRIIYTPK